MDILLGSPWAPYGLRDDPFFQQPLQPTSDSEEPRPITLFVGRGSELRLVANQVLGSSNSRAIIEGDAGVGKTSFVSRLKAELGKHGVLMHAEPVRVRAGMTTQQFLAEVLKIILQIRATVGVAEEEGKIERVKKAAKDEAAINKESAFWRRIGRVVQGEDSTSVGVSVLGAGGQREKIRIPAEVEEVSLFGELNQAVEYLTMRGQRKLLIHVNNMENLSLEASADAANLIQQVRDCFMTDYSHWLFVGTTGIQERVFRASRQVSDIIPFAITLAPLTQMEVAELLRLRYEHLQKGRHLVPPVSPQDGAELYRRYHGQLRSFLSLISSAVQRHAAFAPGSRLSVEDVITTMAPSFHDDKLVKRIGQDDALRLSKALSGKTFDTEFRVTDLARANEITQASSSHLVQRLLRENIIRLSRKQGKNLFYQLAHGDWSVALNLK